MALQRRKRADQETIFHDQTNQYKAHQRPQSATAITRGQSRGNPDKCLSLLRSCYASADHQRITVASALLQRVSSFFHGMMTRTQSPRKEVARHTIFRQARAQLLITTAERPSSKTFDYHLRPLLHDEDCDMMRSTTSAFLLPVRCCLPVQDTRTCKAHVFQSYAR